MTLREIGAALGVSGKTVYYWTKDLPVPRVRTGGDRAHRDMMRRRYRDPVLARRDEERQRVQSAHAARIGMSFERELELELAAVVAYWCEGCRSKPYAGCLVVRLRQCRTLYQRIEGTWQGIMGGLPERSTDDLSRVV